MGENEFVEYETEGWDETGDVSETDDGLVTEDVSEMEDGPETEDVSETENGPETEDVSETEDGLEAENVSVTEDAPETEDGSVAEGEARMEDVDKTDGVPEEVAQSEVGNVPEEVSPSEADSIPEDVSQPETGSIPEVVALSEADNVPEDVSQHETSGVSEDVTQSEAGGISKEVAQSEVGGVPEEVTQPKAVGVSEEVAQSEMGSILGEIVQPEAGGIPEEVAQSEAGRDPKEVAPPGANGTPNEVAQTETSIVTEEVPQSETNDIPESDETPEGRHSMDEVNPERLFYQEDEETAPLLAEIQDQEVCPGQRLAETTFQETRQEIIEQYGHWMIPQQRETLETAKSEETIQVQYPKFFYAQENVPSTVKAYFDSGTGMIYICDGERTIIGYRTAHETVHKSSHSEFTQPDGISIRKDGLIEWGNSEEYRFHDALRAVNEGVTELFTRKIYREVGGADRRENPAYDNLHANADRLANFLGQEVVEKAYFDNGMRELREIIQKYDGENDNAWETFCRDFAAGAGGSTDAQTAWNAQMTRIWRNLRADKRTAGVRV